MGEEGGGSFSSSGSGSGSGPGLWPPIGAPLLNSLQREDDPWRSNFDNSVNAVSFGFVATAILISMFLVMAIFEKFLRPTSPAPTNTAHAADPESHLGFNPKLGHPSPKMSVYTRGVSVLMPGDHIPTYIANPAPAPVVACPHEPISWPHHHQQHNLSPNPTANSNSNPSSIRED